MNRQDTVAIGHAHEIICSSIAQLVAWEAVLENSPHEQKELARITDSLIIARTLVNSLMKNRG